MYKHVIFDVDGTIINGDAAWLYATQRAIREELGKEFTFDELKYTLGMPDELIYKELGVDDPTERARIIAQEAKYYLSERHTNCYYDGILELFNALEARGLVLGIVTSRKKLELEDPLLTKILPRFGIAVTGEMVKNLKPHPEPMEMYLTLAGVQKSEVLFIGDTRFDVGCAQNAGVDFALAIWGTHSPDMQAKYKPTHPMELLSWV